MNTKTIVVLGGSFNPPTKAHIELLKSTVEQLDATLGLFVPASNRYVEKKMSRQKQDSYLYSEKTRYDMLKAICKDYDRLNVDTCEYGDDGKGHTYDTLCKIQKRFPGYKIIFIVGADKVHQLPRWHHGKEFLNQFEFAVTHRNGIDIERIISNDKALAQHRTSFHEITLKEDVSDVSSTMVRHYVITHQNDKLKDMLHPSTLQFL